MGTDIAHYGVDVSQVRLVKYLGLILAALSLNVVAAPCLPENFEGIEVVGVARDPDGTLLYCEWHKPQSETQTLVEYHDAEGKVFASKELLFGDDRSLPQVKQMDKRSGERFEVEKSEDSWNLYYQKHQQSRMEQTQVLQQEVDVIDAGFDHKIRASWNALTADEKLRINFAAPALQRVVPLRVTRRTDDKCAFMQSEWQCIWVEADNRLVRFFVDPLQLTYDDERRLRVFSGVVNIRDPAGDKQAAVIQYFYGEEKTSSTR